MANMTTKIEIIIPTTEIMISKLGLLSSLSNNLENINNTINVKMIAKITSNTECTPK